MKKILLTIVACGYTFLYGQPATPDFFDPDSLINTAIQLHQQDKNDEAFKMLDKLDENDSVYMQGLFTKASILYDMKEYEKVIDLCRKAAVEKSSFHFSFNIYYGVSLMNLGKNQECIDLFKDLLETYPMSYLIYYNMGVAYAELKQYDQAIESYQTSILLNPYYPKPHKMLGDICFHENKMAQALLCYDTYLLINPNYENALNFLIDLNNALRSKMEKEPKNITISPDDESFKDIDLLLNNYVALNNNYKISNKMDVPLVKQNHLLISGLSGFKGKDGFWSQKYVPLYKKIMEKGYFDAFIYRIMDATTNDEYVKIIKKNEGLVNEFVKWVADEWSVIVGTDNAFMGKFNNCFYYSSGELRSTAQIDANNLYSGECNFYFKSGNISTKGEFANDKRSGTWVWFNEDGSVTEEMQYADGLAEGSYKKYHPNGNLMVLAELKADKYNGTYKKYSPENVLSELTLYSQGNLDGLSTLYHPLGEKYVHSVLPYKNDMAEGKQEVFYPGGEKKMEVSYIGNFRTGEEKHFFTDGRLSELYTYDKGVLNGKYESYFSNGNLQQSGMVSDGMRNGEWKYYYITGELQSVTPYENGNLSGKYSEYERNGKVKYEIVYKNNKLISYTYYNSKGEITGEGTRTSGGLKFGGFNYNGTPSAKGLFDSKGNKTGEWNFYTGNGFPFSNETYRNDTILSDLEFYVNGKPESVTPYKNGMIDGIFKKYYINGTVSSQGFYKQHKLERYYLNYYPDGSLSSKVFYFHDKPFGCEYDYSVEGKLYSCKYFNDEGLIKIIVYFDTTGNVIDTTDFFSDKEQKIHYANGKVKNTGTYLNGYAHGSFKWYYLNGVVETEGNFFNGERHGKWIWRNDAGLTTLTGNFIYGKETGIWYRYHDNGTLESEKNYVDGMLHGSYKTYNEKGLPDYEAVYVYGELDGEVKFFNDDGVLEMTRYYDHGILTGYSYPGKDGNILPVIPIEKESGKIISYYSSGAKSREYEIIDRKFHGEYLKYFENGSPAAEDHYEAGVQSGPSVSYFPNGKMHIECTYLNDALHGAYTEYYENGNVRKKLSYLNGELTGWNEFYRENGSLLKKIYYFNGQEYDAVYY